MRNALIYHGGGAAGKRGFPAPIPTPTDELLKVSNADTTAQYLNDKLTVSHHLSKYITSPAANERLNIQGDSQFTLYFANANPGLAHSHILCPSDYTLWPIVGTTGRESGYYTNCGYKIKKVVVMVQKFLTNSVRTLNFRFRRVNCNGTLIAEYAIGDGDLIGDFGFNVPNTGGTYRFYYGNYDDISWDVASGLLYCYIQYSNLSNLDGINLYLHCTKTDPVA